MDRVYYHIPCLETHLIHNRSAIRVRYTHALPATLFTMSYAIRNGSYEERITSANEQSITGQNKCAWLCSMFSVQCSVCARRGRSSGGAAWTDGWRVDPLSEPRSATCYALTSNCQSDRLCLSVVQIYYLHSQCRWSVGSHLLGPASRNRSDARHDQTTLAQVAGHCSRSSRLDRR